MTRRGLAIFDAGQRSGLKWFIPAVLRDKRLLGEVLVASLFIQLFALITPMFFLVMIDKVLVHEGRSTLHVLAIGLLAVSLFDVLLNMLRTYVFSHTTSRIDVLLASKLFDHLSRLPISYFKARSSVYYTPREVPAHDLALMRRIDELHLVSFSEGDCTEYQASTAPVLEPPWPCCTPTAASPGDGLEGKKRLPYH